MDDRDFLDDDPDAASFERELDEEFPLGNGTADVVAAVLCPYCAAENEIALDPGGGVRQVYVEDCQVCCQPWRVEVRYRADGGAEVEVQAADE